MRMQCSRAAAMFAAVGVCAVASADFSGAYAPANWTVFDEAGGSVFQDSSTAILTSGDVSVVGFTTLTINAAADGDFSFDWDYFSTDTGTFDEGGYILNGVTTPLAFNQDSPLPRLSQLDFFKKGRTSPETGVVPPGNSRSTGSSETVSERVS